MDSQGSMAQCRVHGKEINKLNGIKILMDILRSIIQFWSDFELGTKNDVNLEQYHKELDVAIVVLGALRDLSCGIAPNRRDIGTYRVEGDHIIVEGDLCLKTGFDIISFFITRHKHQTWEEIPTRELKSMTAALGVTRNITHSTPFNCQGLHSIGMTEVFANRLRGRIKSEIIQEGEEQNEHTFFTTLPDAAKPWREASYRLAGTLINMAEKCKDAADYCAREDGLIWILIDSWGGVKDWTSLFDGDLKKAIPCLHLGLFAILTSKLQIEDEDNDELRNLILEEAQSRVLSIKQDDGKDRLNRRHLLDIIHGILSNEGKRKRKAQERENARKANK